MIWDVNRDGVLSKPEFIHYTDMPSIFDMLDRDANGYVDPTELQSALDMLKNKDEVEPTAPPIVPAARRQGGVGGDNGS